MNINSYFDKIYVLNLFRRKDRIEKTKDKLDSLNINYEVFYGVDGSVINHIWNKLDNKYFTNSAYLACSISHLSIYQDAIVNNYNKILILEDDNLINKNIHSIFDNLIIPEWQDLFYLGYIPLTDDLSMWNYNLVMRDEMKISNNIFKVSGNLWGLYSYGISVELMKEIVNVYNENFPMEIDRYFVNIIQRRGKSIGLSPQLFCCDESSYSDNMKSTVGGLTRKSIDARFAEIDDYI